MMLQPTRAPLVEHALRAVDHGNRVRVDGRPGQRGCGRCERGRQQAGVYMGVWAASQTPHPAIVPPSCLPLLSPSHLHAPPPPSAVRFTKSKQSHCVGVGSVKPYTPAAAQKLHPHPKPGSLPERGVGQAALPLPHFAVADQQAVARQSGAWEECSALFDKHIGTLYHDLAKVRGEWPVGLWAINSCCLTLTLL